jgi:hypothetical protein
MSLFTLLALLLFSLGSAVAAEPKPGELKLRIGMGSAPAPALTFSINGEHWIRPKIDIADWAETCFVDEVLRDIGVYSKFDPAGPGVKIRL